MKSMFFKSFYDRYLGSIVIASLIFYLFVSVIQKAISYFYIQIEIQSIISFVKLIFLIFFMGILIVNYKIKKILLSYLGLFFVIFIVANLQIFSDSFSNFYKSLTLGNFFHLNKYLYPFIFLGTFSLVKNKIELINKYFAIIENVLIVNAIFIFIGMFFSIDYFQSYPHSIRFGYSGILDRVFVINFSIIIISRYVFLKEMDWKLVFICLGSLLTGTKLAFLFFTILGVYYFYYKGDKKFFLILSGILVLSLIFIKPIIVFMTKLFPFWQPLLEKHGYLTLLLSNRDLNWIRALEYLQVNGTIKNLLIGGVEFPTYLVEMDFIDLFLFFGIIGGILYVLLLSKILNKGYHLIPLMATFFAGGFLLGTITICTFFLWCYETNLERNKISGERNFLI